MLDALPFIAVDLALGVLAIRRPWIGVVVLLGGLPISGALSQVVPRLLGLSGAAQLAMGGWHDALVGGVALAAAIALIRSRDRALDTIEWLVAAMLGLGAIYVIVSPALLTAVYVYRVLYEPPLLLASITVLARTIGMPGWLPSRAALALIGSTTVSALFAWPQVYLLRFTYLQTYYANPGEALHFSFLAKGLNQPRAIGLTHSPNEFGAGLAIAFVLLAAPHLLAMRDWVRAWLLAAIGLALLLSFSRSGWLATLIAVAIVMWLSPGARPSWASVRAALRQPGWGVRVATPILVALVLTVAVFTTSGAAALVKATATGTDPSAGNRPASVRAGLLVLKQHPLGLGLGTAGPKAARFNEEKGKPRILTETWYILYAIQVGVIGFGLLAVTTITIVRRLWRDRLRPISRLALAILFGLGTGAIFIPVIEDPSIFTPLWALIAFALVAGASQLTSSLGQAPSGR